MSDLPPETLDPSPWEKSPRLTKGEYCRQVIDNGGTPTLDGWMDHLHLTDAEIELLDDLIETRRGSHTIDEFEPRFRIRYYGGKARIGWWGADGELITMSHDEFKKANSDRIKIEIDDKGKPKVIKLAEVWIDHPFTRKYESVEFRPWIKQEDMPAGILNMWTGWPANYVPGWDSERRTVFDAMEEPIEGSGFDLFYQHMKTNMCRDDEQTLRYLLGWMADTFWNPGPCETAVVMQGPQGSGKTLFAECFMSFFGRHGITVDDPDQLIGNFNKHLQDVSVVFADEAFFAGNRKHAAKLKTFTTKPMLRIEPKGCDSFEVPKKFRLILATNDAKAVHAEFDDRRNLVLNVDAGKHNQDKAYFGAILDEWNRGGRYAMFCWLTGAYWGAVVGKGAFKNWVRPRTRALERQMDLSISPPEQVIQNMLATGDVPCDHLVRDGRLFVPTMLLIEAEGLDRSTVTAFGRLFRKMTGETVGAKRVEIEGHRNKLKGRWLPPLSEARGNWEQHLKRKVDWPADVTAWEIEGEAHVPF